MGTVQYENERMLLFQAAGSNLGIVVETTDFQKDLASLYKAYRLDKGLLPPLEFRKSPWRPTEEIWIVRVDKAADGPQGANHSEAPPPAIDPLDLDNLSLEDLDL